MPLPAGAIGISPWLDLALTGATLRKNQATDYLNHAVLSTAAQMYLNGHDPHDPLASPLYADPHALASLPPLLIQVGESEMLLDDSRRFAHQVRAAGGSVELEVWPGMVHVWHFTYMIEPQARRAVQSAGSFMSRCWGEPYVRQEPPPGLLLRPRTRAGSHARRLAEQPSRPAADAAA
jgi:acetyl esterase/lipase